MDIDELIAKLKSDEMTEAEFQRRLDELIDKAAKEARQSYLAEARESSEAVPSFEQVPRIRGLSTLLSPEESVAEQRIKAAAKIARSI